MRPCRYQTWHKVNVYSGFNSNIVEKLPKPPRHIIFWGRLGCRAINPALSQRRGTALSIHYKFSYRIFFSYAFWFWSEKEQSNEKKKKDMKIRQYNSKSREERKLISLLSEKTLLYCRRNKEKLSLYESAFTSFRLWRCLGNDPSTWLIAGKDI